MCRKISEVAAQEQVRRAERSGSPVEKRRKEAAGKYRGMGIHGAEDGRPGKGMGPVAARGAP